MNAPVKVSAAQAETNFDEAFVKLQSELGPARKLATNPAFRSKYADLGAVWDAIMGPLHSNGFGLMQVHQFEGESDYLETILIHAPSRGRVTGRYRLRPARQDPQGYGSATTYARRYAACSMLGVIADDDDDGNAASAPAAKPVQQAAPQQEPEKDQDIEDGVKNWVAQQKGVIAECKTLPELTDWLDRNGGDLLKPSLGSVLNRLMKKNNPAFIDLKNFYLDRMNKI